MTVIRTQNPANEVFLREYTEFDAKQIEKALALSHAHAEEQRENQYSIATRQHWLRQLADSIERHTEQAAQRATEEMGKPVREARAELQKSAATCRYYADHIETMLAPQTVPGFAEVHVRPLGSILAIMPWNFPYWQLFRVFAPALALGNALLLKHAENVWGCAEIIEDVIRATDIPEGAFQNLYVQVPQIADIIADERVSGVTLTGSERAGSAVAAQAGKAIKPFVLELGGSDPFIVLADADLHAAVEAAVHGRFQNSGQSCIASKRIIVEAPLYDRFARLFTERVEALTCDDPVFESTQIGPMARADLRDELDAQVRETVGYGARVLCGGHSMSGRGFYYAPTVLADVQESMPAFREELFGPVASLIVAQDADDAIRLANATSFGLGASIWTDSERGRALAGRIEAGMVAINRTASSDPRVPFGGIKRSGVGRELGVEGIRSFANIQTVLLDS